MTELPWSAATCSLTLAHFVQGKNSGAAQRPSGIYAQALACAHTFSTANSDF